MSIANHLSAADVMLDTSVKNKRHLLETMAAKAAERLERSGPEVLAALQSREALGSTALGKGVALPHAELPGAAPPIMLFARLLQPVEFDARDGEPVDLVFMVLWPAAETKGLLDNMAEICRVLRDQQMLRRLRLAETPAEVVRLLQSGPDTPDADR